MNRSLTFLYQSPEGSYTILLSCQLQNEVQISDSCPHWQNYNCCARVRHLKSAIRVLTFISSLWIFAGVTYGNLWGSQVWCCWWACSPALASVSTLACIRIQNSILLTLRSHCHPLNRHWESTMMQQSLQTATLAIWLDGNLTFYLSVLTEIEYPKHNYFIGGVKCRINRC
jgi:hypothetical protein